MKIFRMKLYGVIRVEEKQNEITQENMMLYFTTEKQIILNFLLMKLE